MNPEVLNQISFKEMNKDPKLHRIENTEEAVKKLLSTAGNKGIGKTQIHKLLALNNLEENTIFSFGFKKHHFGPYSDEVNKTLKTLSQQNTIQEKKESVYDYEKTEYVIKNKEKDDDSLKQTYEKYNEYGARALGDKCYNTLYLKKKGEREEEWSLTVKSKIDELLELNYSLFTTFYELEINENKKILVCTSFDYISKLLTELKNKYKQHDQVAVGKLLYNIDSFLDKWQKIKILADEGNPSNIISLYNEANKKFKFINEESEKNNVFESVF